MSVFSDIKTDKSMEIITFDQVYAEDPNENKVSLTHTEYRTDKGESWVLPIVMEAEKIQVGDGALTKNYVPVLGLDSFTSAATKLLLGKESPAILENRTISVQTISATGGLYLIAQFLAKIMDYKTVYNSKPTWQLYEMLFESAGFEVFKTYRYWSESKRRLNLDGLLKDLSNAPENSVVMLQVSGHNPTGCDPTEEEWKLIADVIEENKLFPVMDCAFQGIVTGHLNKDAWPVRYFVSRGLEMICCQSFSTNFGIYNDRVGNVIFVVNDESVIPKIKSQASIYVLSTYLSPPNHGARTVAYILNDPVMFEIWKGCLKTMAKRITDARAGLKEALERLETPGNWKHIITQKGMYSYIGLKEHQCTYLTQNYHIYIRRSGGINITGIQTSNTDYIANAIRASVIKLQE